MQKKTDVSYGIIPVRMVEGKWEVFLIHQFSRIGDNSYWVFPKGHPEEGESSRQTALRELKEETGLTPAQVLSEPTFKLAYSFVYKETRIEKTVEFFVGVIADFAVTLDPEEVKEAGWYSIEAAKERLDYKDTKQMFEQITAFLVTYK